MRRSRRRRLERRSAFGSRLARVRFCGLKAALRPSADRSMPSFSPAPLRPGIFALYSVSRFISSPRAPSPFRGGGEPERSTVPTGFWGRSTRGGGVSGAGDASATVGEGVSALGEGVSALGGGVAEVGEGVSGVGNASARVGGGSAEAGDGGFKAGGRDSLYRDAAWNTSAAWLPQKPAETDSAERTSPGPQLARSRFSFTPGSIESQFAVPGSRPSRIA